MRKFVLDCDTGTDDAIAIIATLGCADIELLGITSVNGNVMEDYVAHNNLNLMEYDTWKDRTWLNCSAGGIETDV